jgi:acid phosphatase type 7
MLYVPRIKARQDGTITNNLPNRFISQFIYYPGPTGKSPFRLYVDAGPSNAECLTFHVAGDTGDSKNTKAIYAVELAMEADIEKDRKKPGHKPAFLYHLGDVAYEFGSTTEYYNQFYKVYAHYPAPIFAIAGNKDGDFPRENAASLSIDLSSMKVQRELSLRGFMRNFCAKDKTPSVDSVDIPRDAQVQPNVYWTMREQFCTIIGLYSNVPDGGSIDLAQEIWFQRELSDAPRDRALIVAVHQPPFSGDEEHSGSEYMRTFLYKAFNATHRLPHLVMSGHVHNYQRFSRKCGKDSSIPYIVLGNSGHSELHAMQSHKGVKVKVPHKLIDTSGVTLEKFIDNRNAFMRLRIDKKKIVGKVYALMPGEEAWLADEFTVNLNLSPSPSPHP